MESLCSAVDVEAEVEVEVDAADVEGQDRPGELEVDISQVFTFSQWD